MDNMIKNEKAKITWFIASILLLSAFGGCKAPAKFPAIGIVTTSYDTMVIEGFKEGMSESGYIEGENIKYIKRITDDAEENIDAGVSELLSQDVDILLAIGDNVALRCKLLVEGTETPVIFSSSASPVKSGLIEDLKRPRGNLTGVKAADNTSKALEWLVKIVPTAKRIHLPYDPDDEMSIQMLDELEKTASKLGVELVLNQIHSVEEAIDAIENLSKDVDAIFRIPSPTLDKRNSGLSQAAIKQGIPMGASIGVDESFLVAMTTDFFEVGKMKARLAHLVLNGIKPADIPIETSENLLVINLKTAEKLGIQIPNDILVQATTIIR